MVSEDRRKRISSQVMEELSNLLIFDLSDPRVANTSITQVRVDRELAYANIFVSSFLGSENKVEIIAGFNAAKGYIRRQLAQKIQLRSFPQLRFYWDPAPEHADRMDKLFAEIRNERENSEENNEENKE